MISKDGFSTDVCCFSITSPYLPLSTSTVYLISSRMAPTEKKKQQLLPLGTKGCLSICWRKEVSTWESLLTFLGLSFLICKMQRIVPVLISNRVTVRVEWDTVWKKVQFCVQERGESGLGWRTAEALGGGSLVRDQVRLKSVSCSGVGGGSVTGATVGSWTGLFGTVLGLVS